MAPDEPTPEVLTSLPRTRPQRRSSKRDAPRKAAAPKTRAAAPKKAAPKAAAKPRKVPAPQIPPAGFEAPRDQQPAMPSGTELVGTAIQAAGELAQIGAAVGKQALKSALGRLGR